jgi:hypothetical protein
MNLIKKLFIKKERLNSNKKLIFRYNIIKLNENII